VSAAGSFLFLTACALGLAAIVSGRHLLGWPMLALTAAAWVAFEWHWRP